MKLASTLIALTLLMVGDDEQVIYDDQDNDGVLDIDDLCDGSDDTVDLNGNDIPDCSETHGPNLMFDDAQSIDSVTYALPTVANWTNLAQPHDGNGWSESGTLVLYGIDIGGVSKISVCVDVSPYYDYLGVWFHARTGTTPSVSTFLGYHQFDARGCTGPSTSVFAYPGLITPYPSTPWPVVDDELELAASTRSVRIEIGAFTTEPWLLDNILLLPRIASDDDDGSPSQN